MSNTVWDSISSNLHRQVTVEPSLSNNWGRLETERRHEFAKVENLEYALAEAEDAIGRQALSNLLKRAEWQETMTALGARRALIESELGRLDDLLIIIGQRQTGQWWERDGNGWSGDDDPPTYRNPSITLTDDQVTTVKEHT